MLLGKHCLSLAVDNANPACKHILQGLPKRSSIAAMMEACERVGSSEERAGFLASAFAAAIKPSVHRGKGDRGAKCYNCGKSGHMRAQCRFQKPKRESFAGTCKRCRRFGHCTIDCHSKHSKDGTPLGNGGTSASRPSAMTQVRSQAAWMAWPLPQQKVPEWMWPQQ